VEASPAALALASKLTATTAVCSSDVEYVLFPTESGDGNGVTNAGASATTSATTTGDGTVATELRSCSEDSGTAITTDSVGDITAAAATGSVTGVTTAVVTDACDNAPVLTGTTVGFTAVVSIVVGSVTRRTKGGRESLGESSPWLEPRDAFLDLSASLLEWALLGSLEDRERRLSRGSLCGTALSSLLTPLCTASGVSTIISEVDVACTDVAPKHTGSDASIGRVTEDAATLEESISAASEVPTSEPGDDVPT